MKLHKEHTHALNVKTEASENQTRQKRVSAKSDVARSRQHILMLWFVGYHMKHYEHFSVHILMFLTGELGIYQLFRLRQQN